MEDVIQIVKQQLETNQFMSGGFVLMILGGALAYLRALPAYLWRVISSRVFTSLQISDDDDAFTWIERSLIAKKMVSTSNRHFQAHSRVTRNKCVGGGLEMQTVLSPAVGVRLLRFDGSLIFLRRTRKDKEYSANYMKPYREEFTLFAFRQQTLFNLLQLAYKNYTDCPDDRLTVCFPNAEGNWVVRYRPAKPLDSVILAGGDKEAITVDLEKFIASEGWYNDMDVDYHRGYILEGPPGSGKTSLVKALATNFDRSLYVVDLSKWTDTMDHAMKAIPEGSFVLIEDIDAVFDGRENIVKESKLGFNTLLNMVDGVDSSVGLVFFFTTNHKEKLDPALTRPGRCDMSIHMGPPTTAMASDLFLRFFPGEYDYAQVFSESVGGDTSMAALQEHLMSKRNNVALAARWNNSPIPAIPSFGRHTA